MVSPVVLGDAPFGMNAVFAIATAVFIAVSVGPLAALPTLIAVVLAEWFAIRSFLYFAFVGALIGVAALELGPVVVEGAWTSGIGPLHLTGGLVGGAVYWLLAGRHSGLIVANASVRD